MTKLLYLNHSNTVVAYRFWRYDLKRYINVIIIIIIIRSWSQVKVQEHRGRHFAAK